jgi:hypothetical protein
MKTAIWCGAISLFQPVYHLLMGDISHMASGGI